jgi:serine protease Do
MASATHSGIRTQRLTDQLRDFFGVFTDEGVLVSSVDMNSDGEQAGVKAGDVITSINGTAVRNPAQFAREMRRPNSGITLKIMRDKKEQEIKVR